MANRSRRTFVDLMLASFRAQKAEGRCPNFARAAADAGVGRPTARRYWERGAPGTSKEAPVPPMRELLADPPPAAPAPAALAPVEQANAEMVARSPMDVAVIEARAVNTVRGGVEGVAEVAATLLAGLAPCAAAAKRRLEIIAQTEDCDPLFVLSVIERLSDALAGAAKALGAVVAAQSTLDGRPNLRIDDQRDTAIRAAIGELAAALNGRELRHSLPPLDVTPARDADEQAA